MTTSIELKQILRGVRLVTLLPLTDDNMPTTDPIKIYGVTDIPIQTLIEQGERIIDKADGIGVIGMHEEDDTILGVDFSLSTNHLNMHLFEKIMGGINTTENNQVIGWSAPSIQEQRDKPKRFQIDIYVPTLSDAYLKHCFFYCKGTLQGLGYGVQKISEPSISIKARPHPITKRTSDMSFVTQIPTM
jgi:hypothetical protein